jgi:hypothetical protein
MRLAPLLKRLAIVATLAATLPASAAVIDFDGTGASGVFVSAPALSDYYLPLGVTFSGAAGLGGSILNQSAELGFMARSGTDFLVLNTEAGTGQAERIAFSNEQHSVSIHAATYGEGTFTLTAFDAAGNVLAFITQAATREWQALTLNHAGIRSVVVEGTTVGWGLDDLSFEGNAALVPEPAGLALFGAGLLGLVGMRRRRS